MFSFQLLGPVTNATGGKHLKCFEVQKFCLAFGGKALEDMMCRATFCLIKLQIRCKQIIKTSLWSSLTDSFYKFLQFCKKPRTQNNPWGLYRESGSTRHSLHLRTLHQASQLLTRTLQLLSTRRHNLCSLYTVVYPSSPRYCFPSKYRALQFCIQHIWLFPPAMPDYDTGYKEQACSCCLANLRWTPEYLHQPCIHTWFSFHSQPLWPSC